MAICDHFFNPACRQGRQGFIQEFTIFLPAESRVDTSRLRAFGMKRTKAIFTSTQQHELGAIFVQRHRLANNHRGCFVQIDGFSIALVFFHATGEYWGC